MTRLALLFALAACSTSPTPTSIRPRSCGSFCTTSQECGDFFGNCRFCGPTGTCSSTLPALPIGTDAGIDAAPGDTTP